MKRWLLLSFLLVSMSSFAHSRKTMWQVTSKDKIAFSKKYTQVSVISILHAEILEKDYDAFLQVKVELEGNVCKEVYKDSFGILETYGSDYNTKRVHFTAEAVSGVESCTLVSIPFVYTYKVPVDAVYSDKYWIFETVTDSIKLKVYNTGSGIALKY